jgi:hypothetical protein
MPVEMTVTMKRLRNRVTKAAGIFLALDADCCPKIADSNHDMLFDAPPKSGMLTERSSGGRTEL